MRAFVAMAHFDPRGRVAPHVRRHVEALQQVAERLVVVSTADLQPEDEAWLKARCELVRRENYGYDFLSYRMALLEADDLTGYDHVIVCNDTFVGPIGNYRRILAEMDQRPVDFWGLTKSVRIAPHVQSFFVCFRPWVVRSQAFEQFWLRMSPLSDRRQVILRYEVGMSGTLQDAGFASGSYYVETAKDERIARQRILWWAWLRSQNKPIRDRVRLFRRFAAEAWNPCIALADRVLDGGRLPIVKIDTLRYDPYGLVSDRLLRSCEAQYPDEFSGVRDYLDESASFYPHRPNEQMPLPDPMIRPFLSSVRYA
jgi:Rhamnan synthesis protein F